MIDVVDAGIPGPIKYPLDVVKVTGDAFDAA
jgi:hypothetical protein